MSANEQQQPVCVDCEGKGYVGDGSTCPTCEGEGTTGKGRA